MLPICAGSGAHHGAGRPSPRAAEFTDAARTAQAQKDCLSVAYTLQLRLWPSQSANPSRGLGATIRPNISAIAEYLTEALEDSDPSFISKAIGTAARARGMSEVAREAGVSRENLYRALSGDTKPEFDTIRRVLDALGVRLEVKPKAA